MGVLCAFLALQVSDFSPKADNAVPGYSECWNSPGSTWDGSNTLPSSTPIVGYQMVPSLMGAYWPTYTLHWTYDMTGYTGQDMKTTYKYRGVDYWYGTYKPIQP